MDVQVMADQPKARMAALIYDGHPISEREEFLCLTDMWRAAGSDPSKKPTFWLRQDGPREFADFIAGSLKLIPDQLVSIERGGTDPGTWAHWQLGMAYAKYLSPEFHAWCNEIVRAHMERRDLPIEATQAAITISSADLERFAEKVGEGAIKAARGFLAETVEPRFDHIETRFDGVENRLAVMERKLTSARKTPSKATKIEHIDAIFRLGGRCPCGCTRVIVDENGGKLDVLEFDHFYEVDRASVSDTWPLHKICNAEFNEKKRHRHEFQSAFDAYQKARTRLPGRQIAMFG